MKILIVNTVPTERNGITNVIFNLHQAMDKRDIIIDYVSINEPATIYYETIRSSGGKLYVLPRRIKKILSFFFQLRELVRKNRYDAVHVHGNSATMALEMAAAWLAGCKVRIAHSHNTTCKSMAFHRLMTPVFRTLCTHRLACGDAAGKWLYGNKNFTVVNNGIDTTRFAFSQETRQQIRKQYGFAEEQLVIGHVGNFNEAKNQGFLIDILSCLNLKYRALMIGDGCLRQSVEEKTETMGLENRVIFAGVTERVQDYLCACDMIVMPSLYEGLPLSLIEAQASGLKCLVSENITHEVDKTGNVTFLSLEAGAKKWAQTVQEMKLPDDRNETSKATIERIVELGYDIQTEADKLKDYYYAINK